MASMRKGLQGDSVRVRARSRDRGAIGRVHRWHAGQGTGRAGRSPSLPFLGNYIFYLSSPRGRSLSLFFLGTSLLAFQPPSPLPGNLAFSYRQKMHSKGYRKVKTR